MRRFSRLLAGALLLLVVVWGCSQVDQSGDRTDTKLLDPVYLDHGHGGGGGGGGGGCHGDSCQCGCPGDTCQCGSPGCPGDSCQCGGYHHGGCPGDSCNCGGCQGGCPGDSCHQGGGQGGHGGHHLPGDRGPR